MRNRSIPEATIARLPIYLRCLLDVAERRGDMTISSEALAGMAGVNAAKVRKDLSYLGSYGTRGVGYDVEYLLYQITRELGLTQDWPACIVGAGNLGRALASYKGFPERGFRIRAIFDNDDDVVGNEVGGMIVHHLDELKEVVVDEEITIGIITTPPLRRSPIG
jgi:redox-sensing transcriptional repressor